MLPNLIHILIRNQSLKVGIYNNSKYFQAQHYEAEHAVPEGQSGVESGPMYVVYARHPDSGYLKHVYNVLDRAGQ